MPVFLVIFGFMVDMALVFHGQSKVLRVVQDAHRNYSIGRLDCEEDVIDYITTELSLIDVTPADTLSEYDLDTGIISTGVLVPAGQLQMLGYFSVLSNMQIPITAQHFNEDWIPPDVATTTDPCTT